MALDQCNQATSKMTAEEMADLIRKAPPGPWPEGWAEWDNTQEAHVILAREYAAKIPDYPGTFSGRGIVIAGGARPLPHKGLPHGYFPCLWVLVNKLRMMNCNLPIQVWHLGEIEMDPFSAKLLRALGVECVDAEKVAKLNPTRILCGWELKVFASLHCPFEEVFFLDADNAPINREPSSLFDAPEYLEAGSVFWPDYDGWKLEPGVWRVFGMPYHDERAFESGQFMIDKKKCWKELCMAMWYADHSDFVFRHVYGDKEVFHLGWRLLGTDYAMPKQNPGWADNCCIVQHDFDGQQILLHRVQDKWKLNGGNRRISTPDEALHHQLVAKLKEIWPGALWRNTMPSSSEKQKMRSLIGRRFLYTRVGLDERRITFGPGGTFSEGGAGCESRWDVHEESTGFAIAISGESRPTCVLREMADGSFSGRWMEHEKCVVTLAPIGVKLFTREDLVSRLMITLGEALSKHGVDTPTERIRAFAEAELGECDATR